MGNFWLAFGLTVFAGMGTAVGAVIAFFAKRTNYRFLSLGTGFAAGVMLYISFMEILPEGAEALAEAYGETGGQWANVGAFFLGIALIAIIDALVPSAENPHEIHAGSEFAPLRGSESSPAAPASPQRAETDVHEHTLEDKGLLRTGLMTALAIAIHNLPEGLVTFLTALHDPALGVAIAVAIALHNVPEGVSVSVPIFYATGDRKKAFTLSVLSGMAEPVGALLAYAALRLVVGGGAGQFPQHVVGVMFAVVAGIMVYISLDELLPTSRAYGRGHDSIAGLVAGMAVMALTLLLLG